MKKIWEFIKSLFGESEPKKVGAVSITSLNNSYTALATKIANSNKEVKQFDLFTIWMIAKLIWELVACYLKKKFTEKEAVKMMANPSFIQRFILKRLIKKIAKNNEHKFLGTGPMFASKSEFHDELYTQLISLGKTVKPEELKALLIDFEETGKALGE